MKKLALTFLLFSLMLASFADEIKFIRQDWQAALKDAKTNNKYIFMDAYTDWCSWCKVMDKKTFTDSSVISFMNSNFVPLKMEMENGFGIDMSMKYRVTGFPSFLIFTPQGKLVYKFSGFVKPAEFITHLKNALKSETQLKLEGMSEKIDMPFPEFYKASFKKGKEKKMPDKATVISYLDSINNIQSELGWAVYSRFTSNEKYDNHFIDNIDKLRKLFGNEEVDAKIEHILYYGIQDAIQKNDVKLMNLVISRVDKCFTLNKAKITNSCWLMFYQGTKNWVEYAKTANTYYDKSGSEDIASMNQMAWTLFENTDDATALEMAAGWMKKITGKQKQYALLDTYASILFKLKKYDEALTQANMALAIGRRDGEKTTETEKLISNIEAAKTKK